MDPLYIKTSFEVAKTITKNYSTSFYSATCLLDKSIRDDIFGIYGFVRLADEIVDSFMFSNQKELFSEFEIEYSKSKLTGFSLNPVICAFCCVKQKYSISDELVDSFLASMKADLSKKVYETDEEASKYIYGSAEAVGLMCLKVFLKGNETEYNKLSGFARRLGSAFQKVNFLRDIRQDTEILDRCYFPGVNRSNFNDTIKLRIIEEIEAELNEALTGIKMLPDNCRLGVYTAYIYFSRLLIKIKKTPAPVLISKRVRLSDINKVRLIIQTFINSKVGYF